MGESALRSHAKSARHFKNSSALGSIKLGLIKTEQVKDESHSEASIAENILSETLPEVPPPPSATICKPGMAQPLLTDVVSRNDVLKSEILWTLQTVVTHSSYKSNENISDLFKVMFPDSAVANKFSCGERKTAYMCVFGIADHFKSKLK